MACMHGPNIESYFAYITIHVYLVPTYYSVVIKWVGYANAYIPTHTQTPKEDYVAIWNHQANSPLNVLPDVWSGDLQA